MPSFCIIKIVFEKRIISMALIILQFMISLKSSQGLDSKDSKGCHILPLITGIIEIAQELLDS